MSDHDDHLLDLTPPVDLTRISAILGALDDERFLEQKAALAALFDEEGQH